MNGTVKDEMYKLLSKALSDGDMAKAAQLQDAIDKDDAHAKPKVVFIEAVNEDDQIPELTPQQINRLATRISKVRCFIKHFWVHCLLVMALIGTCGYIVDTHMTYGMPEWQAYQDCITRQIIADQLDKKVWNLHSMEPDGTLRDPASTLDAVHQHSLEVAVQVCPANWGLHHDTDDEYGAVSPKKLHEVHEELMGK